MIRFDGIYQSKLADFNAYIRFYEDGTVITINSTDSPNVIINWFNKENKGSSIGKGKFSLKGSQVKFTTTSINGIIEHEGRIRGDKIIMEAYSRITNRYYTREYEFFLMNFPSGDAIKF